MSTCSSALLIYNFFKYVLDNNDSTTYSVLGIISVVLLSIGNIIYFISAYFSYSYFELIFFEKLGAKVFLHSKKIILKNFLEIFFWVQFNNSMMKTDFGLMLIFLMSSFLFNFRYIAFLVLDSVMAVVLMFNIYMMRAAVKKLNFKFFFKIFFS
jgi:hypothetical protein